MTAKTEAQKRAQRAYMEKFSVARVRMEAAEYEALKLHAQQQGESLNSFMIRAAREQIERDKEAEG